MSSLTHISPDIVLSRAHPPISYMSYNQFCLRVCTAENSTYSAAIECQHTLDEMGCQWVMPGDYTENSFTSCDADAAYPPGVYPQPNGSTSTFAQRYTGTYTASGGSVGTFTVGQTVTPQTPYSTPASSNCKTYTSIGNGIASLAASASSMSKNSTSMTSKSSSASATTKIGAATSAGASGASGASNSAASAAAATSKSAAMATYAGASYGPAVAAAVSVAALFAGAGALFL